MVICETAFLSLSLSLSVEAKDTYREYCTTSILFCLFWPALLPLHFYYKTAMI